MVISACFHSSPANEHEAFSSVPETLPLAGTSLKSEDDRHPSAVPEFLTFSVTVMVLSGYIDRTIVEDLLHLGIDGVLGKPYRLDEIYAEIRKIIDLP